MMISNYVLHSLHSMCRRVNCLILCAKRRRSLVSMELQVHSRAACGAISRPLIPKEFAQHTAAAYQCNASTGKRRTIDKKGGALTQAA